MQWAPGKQETVHAYQCAYRSLFAVVANAKPGPDLTTLRPEA